MNEPHLASAEFGGFWIRFLAVLVDSAVVFLGMALIIAGGAAALGGEMVTIAALAAWLFAFLYWPVMQASKLQATFGKALLGMRLTGYQGNRISFLRSLGRELAKILSSAVFMVGYIMAAFTARKQALHDLVASTYVVSAGKARIVPALATMVAAFVLPIVLVPLLVGGAMVDSMMATMTAMSGVEQPPPPQLPMKAAPRPPIVAAAPKPSPVPELPKPAPVELPKLAPAIETKQVEVPKPVEAAKPEPVAAVAAPPQPVIETKRVELPKPEPKKVAAAKAVSNPAPKPAPKPRPVATAAPAATAVPARPSPPAAAAGPKYNDLMTAVLYRDPAAVSELLRYGRWVDKPDSRGATPLMLAVELGDAPTAEALLKGGADPGRALPMAQARGDGAMLDLLKRYAAR
jgi:uncharacterized RDD family membrane protein YckC